MRAPRDEDTCAQVVHRAKGGKGGQGTRTPVGMAGLRRVAHARWDEGLASQVVVVPGGRGGGGGAWLVDACSSDPKEKWGMMFLWGAEQSGSRQQ